MVKKVLFMVVVAMFALSSCSSVSNVSTADAAAKTMGTTCGTAMSGLYKSYKTDGKLDISNSSVLTNIIAVSTSTANLKTNAKNPEFRKSFISGMVLGSAGLLTNTTAGTVYDKLEQSAGAVSNVNTSSTASTINSAANALTTILGLF